MNPLQQLQEDSTVLLLGNPDTAVVPISSFRKQVIESVANEAMAAWDIRVAGKVGLTSLVLMPSARSKTPNVPGPQYEVELVVRTFEDPKVNNTNLSAEDAALSHLTWLDGLIIAGLMSVYADDKGPALKPNYDFPGFLVYDSTFRGDLPQDHKGRTTAPTISDNGAGLVTLACSDGAAIIYYTITGEAPQPGRAEQIYSAPFSVPSGEVVRCLAWNPAKLFSDVDQGTINY